MSVTVWWKTLSTSWITLTERNVRLGGSLWLGLGLGFEGGVGERVVSVGSFFNAWEFLQWLQYGVCFTSLSSVSGGPEMRHYSRLSTSPDRGLLQGLAVPVGVHLLSKGSWNRLHLAICSCCFWEQVKPREVFFFPVIIIFAVYFMRRFFLISKTFWGSEDIVMPLPFSLLIPPRSAKSGHVYACGTFHLGSGEETFWSQQEEDGRETERLWFWRKNERAQRRGKALLSFHLLSPSFEFYVTNQEEALFFIPLPPPEDSCILNFTILGETFVFFVWDCCDLKDMAVNLSFFSWTVWAYFFFFGCRRD